MSRENQSGLTGALIDEYLRLGRTQKEIAELHGVSKQYVSQLHARQGRLFTAQQKVRDLWPWDDVPESMIRKYLRLHLRYMVAGPSELNDIDVSRLRTLYRRMETRVVVFDRGVKPENLYYAPRTAQDENFVIRIGGETKIPDRELDYWRLPPQTP